jgi:hypothetical protein
LPVRIALSQGLARPLAEKDRATIRASMKIVKNFNELSEDLRHLIRCCDLQDQHPYLANFPKDCFEADEII